MDPEDSLILYAAAYQHRRLPYYFSSGGPGSGLYKSTDGGESCILTVDGKEFEKKAVIHPDPRFPFAEQEWKAQQEALTELIILSKKMGLSITSAKQIRRELGKLYESLKEKQKDKDDVIMAVKSFDDEFQQIEDSIVPKKIGYRVSREIHGLLGNFSR